MGTRAVKIYPVLGYKTDDFLICHENFVANHGVPSHIQTDRGTQLVKARQILAEEKDGPNSWDWHKITHCNSASNWTFVPVGSHHRNGLPEVMIKMLKKSLQQAVHSSITLNFAEFTTLLSKIANCMNDRPLGFFFLSAFQAFFNDFFGSGSEREGLWVWVWGLGVFGFVARVGWVYVGFWWFSGLVKWDWDSQSFLNYCTKRTKFSSVS